MHQLTMVAFNYMTRSLRIILFCIGFALLVGFAASWFFAETNYYDSTFGVVTKIGKEAYEDDYDYGYEGPNLKYSEQNLNIQIGLASGGIALGASFLIAALVFRKPSSNGSVSV